MGLALDAVYVTNLVKCRPSKNRAPRAGEIDTCGEWLERQVALVRPRIIVALGRHAGAWLVGKGKKTKLEELRGDWLKYKNDAEIHLRVIYHPSYLLRKERNCADCRYRPAPSIRETMKDLKAIRTIVETGKLV